MSCDHPSAAVAATTHDIRTPCDKPYNTTHINPQQSPEGNSPDPWAFRLFLEQYPTISLYGTMSVGFGFSVGDFLAAIDLVGTVIDALRSSSEAGSEYRELINQLLSLETTLLQVQKLEFEESQYQEVIALKETAARCRQTINGFWDKARKYQPWLGRGSSSSMRKRKLREGWMKIRWAVCKKEDVAKFKTDLMGHTQSISLLLATVQQ